MKTYEEMKEYSKQFYDISEVSDVSDIDTDFYVYLLDNISTEVKDTNRFFVATNCEYISHDMYVQRRIPITKKFLDENGIRPIVEAAAYNAGMDFGHTCPEWNNILTLGIVGLRQRAVDYAAKEGITAEQKKFYNNVVKVYDAGIRYMGRAAEAAEAAGKTEMAQGIRNLMKDKPQNLFEAIQTLIIYYLFQHTVESTLLRTFWRLDQILYPFYKKETDQEYVKALLDDFMICLNTMDPEAANMPFAIGGLDRDGNNVVNEMSYLLLDAYQRAENHNIKVHLMCSKVTPRDLISKALDGVRNGDNSMLFISDETVIKSLVNIGATVEDARNYSIYGCYETGAYDEMACSGACKLNIPKALEVTLYRGVDGLTGKIIGIEHNHSFDSFEDVFAAFEEQLLQYCEGVRRLSDNNERNAKRLHFAPFFSSNFDRTMEFGGDIYAYNTAKYNNTSVVCVGLATVVDSLAAIRRLVFEDKTHTMDELIEILRNNWEGHEALRLTIKNKFPKYGQADPVTDELAKRVVKVLDKGINNQPNTKGGVYRMGVFSITWRWDLGKKTGATADGRLAGDTLSLNTGANFGATKQGATAHLISVAGIGNEMTPDGSICDIDLHSSAVAGENGLNAMLAALETYFEMGGFAVHYNVLDLETLKAARENPDLYPDLQVRLCGWNTLFSGLKDYEKDEFIARAAEGE